MFFRLVEKGWWWIPVFLAVTINIGILFNGFVWDAGNLIISSEIKALSPGTSSLYFRPLVGMTLHFDRIFWGGNAWGYHLTNLILHALNTLLVTFVGIRVFDAVPLKKAATLLAGSLFAVHPLHSEVVAWISGRNDLVPTLGLLIAVLAHLQYRSGASPFRTLPFFVGGCLMGLFGKESALPFLLLFPLYDLLVWKIERPPWKKLLTLTSFTIIGMIVLYLFFRSRALGTPVGEMGAGGILLSEKARLVFLTTGFYLKKLIWPFPLNPFIMTPSGSAIFSGMYAATGIFGFGLLAYLTIRKKFPMTTLGLWSVFLGFASALAVPLIPKVAVPFAERYLYLPSIGGIFLLTAGLMAGYSWMVRRTRWRPFMETGVFASVLLVGISAGVTINQNLVWKNEESLWEEAVKKSPKAALPQNRLGFLSLNDGNLKKAEGHFKTALLGWGQNKVLATAATGLGVVYHSNGRYPESENAFQRAFLFQDKDGIPHFYMGKMYWNWYQQRKSQMTPEESEVLLEKTRGELVSALIRTPGIIEAYYILGFVNTELGRPSKARTSFRKVIELAPDSNFALEASRRLRVQN